jgi:hypothetical protein
MGGCAFTKPGGERCGAAAMRGYSTCYGHRPDLAEERRLNASKGGRAGGRGRSDRFPTTETQDLKRQLEDLAKDVLEGSVDRGDATVVTQIINTRARLIELERRQADLITPEDLAEQMRLVVDIIRRHMPDRAAFEAFHEDLNEFFANWSQN